MITGYIGKNKYRYRCIKSPLGHTKLLLDVYIGPNFINISEKTIDGKITKKCVRQYALAEIERIEAFE